MKIMEVKVRLYKKKYNRKIRKNIVKISKNKNILSKN